MSAATGRVFPVKPVERGLIAQWRYGLKATIAPFRGWLMGFDRSTGYARQNASNDPDLVSLGWSNMDDAASTVDGNANFLGEHGFVSGYANGTSTDALLATDFLGAVWAADNQTVGKLSNSGGNNRSLVGLSYGLDPDNGLPLFFTGPFGWLFARTALHLDTYKAGEWTFSDAAANTATTERVIAGKPLHGKVSSVTFTGAAVVADNTDFDTITVSKRDGAGGAAVVVATYDTRAANQGAITAFTPAAFALSAVAGALNLLETDVLTVTAVKAGAGKVLTGQVVIYEKVG